VIRNIFIVFLVSGLWHGANWTFIIWGFIHALFFLPLILTGSHQKHLNIPAEGKVLPSALELTQIAAMFMLVTAVWIFFRAASLHQAFDYFEKIFSMSLFPIPNRELFFPLPFILMLMVTEWIQRDRQHALQFEKVPVTVVRWSLYIMITLIIFCFGTNQQKFIYFQF